MRTVAALAAVALAAACGGTGERQFTAQDVVAALRAHGIDAAVFVDLRGPVPPGAPYAGNKKRGVAFMVSSYGDNVDAEVFDTARHARAWLRFDADGEAPTLDGRAYLVGNVVIEALNRTEVRAAAAAAADLRQR